MSVPLPRLLWLSAWSTFGLTACFPQLDRIPCTGDEQCPTATFCNKGLCGEAPSPAPTGDDGGSSDGKPADGGSDDGGPCANTDKDRDGHASRACGGDDCDDSDLHQYPGNPEVCDGRDDDCDSFVDEGVCVPCPSGYSGVDQSCTDVNECAQGVSPCGATSIKCDNTPGSYACTCLGGFAAPPTGGTCADVDECTKGADACDHDPQACANTSGSYACACPTDFSGSGQGVSGCLLTDPGLLSLASSAGLLSPSFASATTTYSLTLPPGTTSLSLTPSVRYPTHATVAVGGATVASGAASGLIRIGFALHPVTVIVATDGGQSRTYTVVIQRAPSTYLKASNTGAGDAFGGAIALSADGSTLAVGAPAEDSNSTGVNGSQVNDLATSAGAVYVFTRTGATWTQQAYLKAVNAGTEDGFGASVALSGDGSTLAVGAPNEDSAALDIDGNQADDSASGAGAVYLFSRTNGTWRHWAYVKASNTEAGDSFGGAVALSSDGRTLAVGAQQEDSGSTGVYSSETNNDAMESGAVYLFFHNGSQWFRKAYLKASNTGGRDSFGRALALSADGLTLAVGAPYEDSAAKGINGNQTDNSQSASGAVYVFVDNGQNWIQQAYVKASNTEGNGPFGDNFGSAVALSSDGSTLAVGARQEASIAKGIDGNQADNTAVCSGAVYVFLRANSSWAQQAYVKASNTGAYDYFGTSVSLSADGSTLAVGAPSEGSSATGVDGEENNDSANGAGATYVFTRAGATWRQQAYVKASNSNASDAFGAAIALTADGRTLTVGAGGESSDAIGLGGDQASNTAAGAGAAYTY